MVGWPPHNEAPVRVGGLATTPRHGEKYSVASFFAVLADLGYWSIGRALAKPSATAISSAMTASTRTMIALSYGAACHSVFALGVGAMMGGMFNGLRPEDATGVLATLGLPVWWALGAAPEGLALAVNAALIAQFVLGHSLLLTAQGRRLLARLAPGGMGETLAPTTYALIAGASLWLLFGLWTPSDIIWLRLQGAALWVAFAAAALAWTLLAKAMLDSGLGLQSGFIGWWALLRGRKPAYPPMPTRGLYGYVRHPIYMSFALTPWAVAVWTPDQLALALAFTAYCALGPRFKEARFRRIYGAAYDAYLAATPFWIARRPIKRPFDD